jgi:NAD(P)-dependent dehydrogenase (short-subunit alcohol dehydrogenase family)
MDNSTSKKFKDKVIIVTGAARGIGKEIAKAFANEGGIVVIVDINEDMGKQVVEEITKSGGKATFHKVDISSYDAVKSMVDKVVEKFGKIDILVNNAAIWVIKLFKDTTSDDWIKEIKVNYIGTLNCIHNVIPFMMERRYGRIINIASDAGRIGEPWLANYAATKGAIISLTKALAKELGRYNITVNCVSPGLTKTPGAEAFIERYGEDRLAKAYPLGRLGLPKDIANAVLFLASDDSEYITGQVISVSGGYVVG